MQLKRLQQTGDTIVEVLLAIAIVSSVLGAAFVTVNRSVKTGRQAQERVEALKLAESQVEALKTFAHIPIADNSTKSLWGGTSITAPKTFCYYFTAPTNPEPIMRKDFSSAVGASAEADDFSAAGTYPSECVNHFYHVSVTRDPADTDHTFVVRVRWDAATGNGRDEVKLLYRIHPGQ